MKVPSEQQPRAANQPVESTPATLKAPATAGYSLTGLRTVALYEATKGILVLVAGLGLLRLVHRDLQESAERLVRHLHMSPAAHYPRIFLQLTARATDGWLWALAGAALAYALLRFTEAYGLWRGRAWAAWLGAISGGIYVPFEAVEIFRKVSTLRVAFLIINLLVIGYLILQLVRRRRIT